jgi:hypothetical protein
MFKVKETQTSFRIKSMRFGEPGFIMIDERGFSTIPRAGFEISRECPEDFKRVILECIQYKWLIPVAHMKESEWIWEKLGE